MAPRLQLKMGLTKVRKPQYASEPGFVSAVNEQLKVLTEELKDIFDQVEGATAEITKEALEPTFEKSKLYCPKDTHELVNSGYLEVTSFRGKPQVEMGYGKGGSPRYAVYVHEMTQYNHAFPTRSKFMEAAINEDMGSLPHRIADGYMRFMGL